MCVQLVKICWLCFLFVGLRKFFYICKKFRMHVKCGDELSRTAGVWTTGYSGKRLHRNTHNLYKHGRL